MINEVLQKQIQETRRKILITLKQRGGQTADELAQTLGITTMGVRRHLVTLEKGGLIKYSTVQRGVGRPSYVYTLTEVADELFPKNYPQFINEMLEIVAELDGREKVQVLFAKRAERLAGRLRPRLTGLSLKDQVSQLARIQRENGYLAEWEQVDENTFRLTEYNCTIAQVSGCWSEACDYELRLFQELLDGEVVREEVPEGEAHGCAYLITARERAKPSEETAQEGRPHPGVRDGICRRPRTPSDSGVSG